MMSGAGGPQAQASTPADRLDFQEKWLLARLDGTRLMKTAFTKLNETLSDDQKKTANDLLAPHMGMGMMAMMALLVMEHLLFNEKLDLARSRLLLRIDALYGTLAGVQIGTGIWRMWLEKGSAYYLSNPLFHAKIGLFALVGLLSLYPTLTFLAWRTGLRQQQAPQIAPDKARMVTMIIRVELLGLLLIPLLAALMARGVGR